MTKNSINTNGIGRVLAIIAVIGFAYFASIGPGWSMAARTNHSAPFTWAIYKPIPFPWKLRMAQFWLSIDPKIGPYIKG